MKDRGGVRERVFFFGANYLYFHFKILIEKYYKTVVGLKKWIRMGKSIFLFEKGKGVFLFLGKGKMSQNSMGKSILTVEALWYA